MNTLGELQDRVWGAIEEATATKDARKLGVLSAIADDMGKKREEWDKRYQQAESKIVGNGGSPASGSLAAISSEDPGKSSSVQWVTADDDATFTGRELRRAMLFGADLNVHAFNELVLAVVAKLQGKHPVEFESEAVLVRGRKPYFSDRPGDLRKAERVEGAKVFVETNLSANYSVRLCRDLLVALREDPKELKLELTPAGAAFTRTRRRRRRKYSDEDFI